MDDYALDIARFIVSVEGGYVNHPDDPGGETKYGISKRAFPEVDIPNLTQGQAALLYVKHYVEPVMQTVSDPRMQALVSDAAVNHGLQRALDWAYGQPTVELYVARRIRFYTGLGTFSTFGKGWMNRLAKVLDFAHDKPMHADAFVDHRSLSARLASASGGSASNVRFNVRPLAAGEGIKLDIA